MLGATVALVVLGSWPLWSHLRRSPAAFPEHVRIEGLDDTLAAARAEARADARRRTTYASDRRKSENPRPGQADGEERPAGWSRLGGGAA
jgi:hypothetical protein